MTQYTYQLTVCALPSQISDANQLAWIVGESSNDNQTFTTPTHTRDGLEYACISTPVKAVVKQAWDAHYLPPNPPHAPNADREAAQRAMATLIVDIRERNLTDPTDVLGEMGFVAIVDDGESDVDT